MSKQKNKNKQSQNQSKLDSIADDYLVRCRQGETPRIDEYVEKFPELGNEIRELLRTIQFVDSFREEEAPAPSKDRDYFVPGTQFGNYLIGKQLGAGGMGVVYEATHLRLKRKVALKVTKADDLRDEEIARFEREMEVSGQLDATNVVATHDAGEIDGIRFIAMELVQGQDLRKIALANAPLSVSSAAELIRQAAIGLQQAHEIGLVHRDIKPSNLMLSNDGVVKILDLGLAKLDQMVDQDELTKSQQIMGTVDYIASEQCKDSRLADIRSDIYSLGATFHKLLTGDPPYSGPSMNSTIEKLTALATVDPPPIETRRTDLPAELASVVNRMTRRDPDERFQLPGDVAEALTPFADAAEFPELLKKVNEFDVDTPVSVRRSDFRFTKDLFDPGRETSRVTCHASPDDDGYSPNGQSNHSQNQTSHEDGDLVFRFVGTAGDRRVCSYESENQNA